LDLSDFNIRDIPMTEWKRSLMANNLNIVIKTLIEFIKLNSKNEDTQFHVKEFYQVYLKLDPKLTYKSIQSFSAQMTAPRTKVRGFLLLKLRVLPTRF
jgi:hypothetical protein